MSPTQKDESTERHTEIVTALATLTERVDNIRTTVSDSVKGLHNRISALDLKNSRDHEAVEARLREVELKMVRVMVYVGLAGLVGGAIIHSVIGSMIK